VHTRKSGGSIGRFSEQSCDEQKEKAIHERLVAALTAYQDWIVSVRGDSGNDDWGIKLKGPTESTSWVAKVTQVENQKVEKVVEIVMSRVRSLT
jgi:hypothetical protein